MEIYFNFVWVVKKSVHCGLFGCTSYYSLPQKYLTSKTLALGVQTGGTNSYELRTHKIQETVTTTSFTGMKNCVLASLEDAKKFQHMHLCGRCADLVAEGSMMQHFSTLFM